MSSKYYCTKCKRSHLYSSKIGEKHLKYKEINETKVDQKIEPDNNDEVLVQVVASDLTDKTELGNGTLNDEIDYKEIKSEKDSNRVVRFIRDYQTSYRKGIELYGVWWKIFQLSIWSIILVLLLTAGIIFVFFLPKVDFINWILK